MPEKTSATQCQRVLQRLHRGPINPLDALTELGVFRLAARINDLRKQGHQINRNMVSVSNRYGETCVVAEYEMRGE